MFRMTFRQSMLFGFLLIATLLSLAAVRSWWLLEHHVERSRQNGAQALLISTTVQEIAERTVDLERSARQFMVLKDKTLLPRIEENASDCLTALQRLENIPGTAFSKLAEDWRMAHATLMQGLLNPTKERPLLTVLGTLTRVNGALEQQARSWISDRNVTLLNELATSRLHVAGLVAVAVFGAFCVALAMNWWLSRPIEMLESSIKRLGESRFDESVTVPGPVDLQLVGQRLDWLRLRLRDLETERERALRHVSHELKTPLTALREGIALLKDEVGEPLGTTQKEIVDILQHNVMTLQRHIETLLHLNAISDEARRLNKQPVSLPGLLNRAIQRRALQIQSRRLVVTPAAPAIVHALDEEKMLVVLDNLLSNAIDFSPEGGSIHLEVENDDKSLRLLCVDEGSGVASEDAERIFEPFVQGQRQPQEPRQGSGVGLSIVRELMAAMGGSVTLLPPAGNTRGATFQIELPHGAEQRYAA